MPTTLLLVRHGENDYVKSKRLAGRTPHVHLNDKGQVQARRQADRLAPWPIAAVYSSPLERCHETALLLAEPHHLPVLHHPGLLETDYGNWQGEAIDELTKTDLWKVVRATPSFVTFPNGETLRSVQQRTVAALHDIASSHPDQNVIVCSHADPIRAALVYYLGAPLDLFQRLEIALGALSIIRFDVLGPRILRLNDTGDLDPPSPPEPSSAHPSTSNP